MPPTAADLKCYEDAAKWIHGWMSTLRMPPDQYDPARNCHVSDTFGVVVGRNSYKKSDLAATARKAWDFVTQQQALIRTLLEENRRLTQRVMDSDATVIKLQAQLIESKDAQLKAVTSTVDSAVRESVEKSYSQVTANAPVVSQPVQPVITPAVIQRAVKDIAEEEERSRNLLIFGLEEQEVESVEARVSEVFDVLGEKPRPDTVSRLGTKREGQQRPVIVKFRSSATASGILKKSQGLRNSERFKRVFISPDRSIAHRVQLRQLVADMKQQAARDTSRRFFIRDGVIESVEQGKRVVVGSKPDSDEESSEEEETDESEDDIRSD